MKNKKKLQEACCSWFNVLLKHIKSSVAVLLVNVQNAVVFHKVSQDILINVWSTKNLFNITNNRKVVRLILKYIYGYIITTFF